MAKKRRRDKELARLRREVEVLRAQLAGQGDTRAARAARVTRETGEEEPKLATAEAQSGAETQRVPKTQPATQTVDPKFIKADLLKSGILTLTALGIITVLTLLL